jgi:hypothetical protein
MLLALRGVKCKGGVARLTGSPYAIGKGRVDDKPGVIAFALG